MVDKSAQVYLQDLESSLYFYQLLLYAVLVDFLEFQAHG